MNYRSAAIAVALVVCGLSVRSVHGCPFCSAVSQTFGEEIATMDVVVITKLVEAPEETDPNATDLSAELKKSKFEIVQFIKGKEWIQDSNVVQTLYFGPAKIGESFLIMGADPPDVMWSSPLLLSERAREYVASLIDLPQGGAERLIHFNNYLEDEDEMLARDAYDEFAKAPYGDLKAIVDQMHHDQLIAWIKDTDVPVSRRRLYMTMLGVCGSIDDTPMLEEMLRSEDRAAKAGLDALIACYLFLKGPDGLPMVEELFLKNQNAEYADTYSAIMALRFHGSEANVISRERLLEGLRYMLDRQQLADLVIPDLARWEDWSVMDRLVRLFKDADEESSWVRVPVVNYLRACPLPEAKEHIKVLQQIDPDAVKRANTFFPFAAATSSTKEADASGDAVKTAEDSEPDSTKATVAAAPSSEDDKDESNISLASAGPTPPVATGAPEVESAADVEEEDLAPSSHSEDELAQSDQPAPVGVGEASDSTADTAPVAAVTDVNIFLLLGVPFVGGLLLLLVLWVILRGAGGQVKS